MVLNLPLIDPRDFEPRPSTPVRSRSSPDKRPICSGAHTINSPSSPQSITPFQSSPRTPFTPLRRLPITPNANPSLIFSPKPIGTLSTSDSPSPAPPPHSFSSPRSSSRPTLHHGLPPTRIGTPRLNKLSDARSDQAPSPILLPASTLRPRAKLTAEAVPRKKQLLPGAPNPSSLFSRSSSPPKHTVWTTSSPPQTVYLHSSAEEDEEEVSDEIDHQDDQTLIQENVLVAIRLRHNPGPSLWEVDQSSGTLWESSSGPSSEWSFDAVLNSACSNKEVYRSSAARGLIRATMRGYDSTIFAYGQTASGKTFTLTGTRDQPGIIPLAVTDIFAFIRAHPHRDFLLRASYLEIYNEQIKDLLLPYSDATPKPIIKVRQDPTTKHFFAAPIREEVVTTEAQVEELLIRGERNRHVSGTDWNARSSRSHTIFAIVVESRAGAGADGIVRRSKACLIDLAGSERATSDSTRRAEGAFINKSLLTLEKVISALAEPSHTHQHVPFRDSKLTQILQPALSGDAKVCVICTINPSSAANALEETRGTLRFAKRVKRVALNAEVKEILSERALITRYRQQIVELQSQLNEAMQSSTPAKPPTSITPTTDQVKAQRLAQAEAERMEIVGRLNKLQSIVLNAANLDQGRAEEAVARPVSPTKMGRMDDERLSENEDEDQEYERLKEHTIAQEQTIDDLRRELECLKLLKSADPGLQELAELRVIVSNMEPERVEERIERRYRRRLELLADENQRRKAFGEEMVAHLEAAQTKAKKLELFIINELHKSAGRLGRPRRSSISTYLPTHKSGMLDGSGSKAEEEEARLFALVDERPEVRSLRASFGYLEVDDV